MENTSLKIGNQDFDISYEDVGATPYKLTCTWVEDETIEDSIDVVMKKFPYYYLIQEKKEEEEKDDIIYIRYEGEESSVIMPHFDCYNNYYAPNIYSYNKTIEKLVVPSKVEVI